MARGLTIEIQGVSKALDEFNRYKQFKAAALGRVVKDTSQYIVADTQENITRQGLVADGALRQSVRVHKVTTNDMEIGVDATYAAYHEFGTGGLVDVPQDLTEYAIQFKGKGIKQINLPARPFFFPAVMKNVRQFVEKIQEEFRKR